MEWQTITYHARSGLQVLLPGFVTLVAARHPDCKSMRRWDSCYRRSGLEGFGWRVGALARKEARREVRARPTKASWRQRYKWLIARHKPREIFIGRFPLSIALCLALSIPMVLSCHFAELLRL